MKKAAVILDGPINIDGRVQRTIRVMLDYFDVDLFYVNETDKDKGLFAGAKGKINLIPFEYNHDRLAWLKKNFSLHNTFSFFEESIEKFSEYDVVLCNDYSTLYYGYRAKLVNPRLKLVYDSHEIFIETFNQFYPNEGWRGAIWSPIVAGLKKYHWRQEEKFMSLVDKMITVNHSLQNFFRGKYGIESEAVYNVPFLESEEKDVSIRKAFGLSDGDKIVLYQGVFSRGRGLEQLIDTFSFVPGEYHLVLIGYGAMENELKNRAARLNLKNVHFMGEVEYGDLHPYTKTADLGILLLQSTNLSKKLASANKIFEYMKAGLPILTTNQPENESVIAACGCGILTDSIEPRRVAEKIRLILEDEPALEKMRAKSVETFRERYNWEIEKKKLERLFSELI